MLKGELEKLKMLSKEELVDLAFAGLFITGIAAEYVPNFENVIERIVSDCPELVELFDRAKTASQKYHG